MNYIGQRLRKVQGAGSMGACEKIGKDCDNCENGGKASWPHADMDRDKPKGSVARPQEVIQSQGNDIEV